MGVDALRANPLRTLLSTTGVVIGVAALVAAFVSWIGLNLLRRLRPSYFEGSKG